MAEWVKYISVFVIATVFAIGLITFISNIETMNKSSVNLLDSNSMSNFNSTLRGITVDFGNATNNQLNASMNEQVSAPTGAFILFSILTSIGKYMFLPFRLLNAYFSAVTTEIGIPSYILYTFISLVILAGIFYWYKSVKQG